MKYVLAMAGLLVLATGVYAVEDQPAGAGQEERPSFRMPPGMDGDIPMMPEKLMTRELNLTKEQQQQVRTLLSAHTGELKAIRVKMEAAAKVQAELISKDAPDEAAVLKGVDDIALLRAEIAKIRIRQVLALHKVLTPEQRATLREKMKARMERHAPGERQRKRGGDKPELQGKLQTPPVPQEKQ